MPNQVKWQQQLGDGPMIIQYCSKQGSVAQNKERVVLFGPFQTGAERGPRFATPLNQDKVGVRSGAR